MSRMQKIRFDTDSFLIGVDTYISRYMTNIIDHFETCVPNNRNNRGRIKVSDGGRMEVKGRGTVTWKLDDYGVAVHKVKIRETLYVPKLDSLLLASQHAAQEFEKEPGTIHVTQCVSNCVI